MQGASEFGNMTESLRPEGCIYTLSAMASMKLEDEER